MSDHVSLLQLNDVHTLYRPHSGLEKKRFEGFIVDGHHLLSWNDNSNTYIGSIGFEYECCDQYGHRFISSHNRPYRPHFTHRTVGISFFFLFSTYAYTNACN